MVKKFLPPISAIPRFLRPISAIPRFLRLISAIPRFLRPIVRSSSFRPILQGRFWFLLAKTFIFNGIKAAFMQLKEKASLVFLLNITCMVSFYVFVYVAYCLLNIEPKWFVTILLVMAESSAIYFSFCAKDELSRFQSLFSLFLSFFITLCIFEKVENEIFFDLFFPVLLLSFVLAEYEFFCPFDFFFLVVLFLYTKIGYEIFLWDFFLIGLLLFLYLLFFLFRKKEEESTTTNKKVAVSLLILFVFFFVQLDFDLQAVQFWLKMLFLVDAALLIYLCFLSTTGWELIITAILYIIINVIIGRILCDNTALFLTTTLLYLTFNFLIILFLQIISLKTGESLKEIFDKVKIRLVGHKLVFLIILLSAFKLNESCNWIWPWLYTFMAQIIGFNYFFVFFEKETDLFKPFLTKHSNTFLPKLIIFFISIFFVFLFPKLGFFPKNL